MKGRPIRGDRRRTRRDPSLEEVRATTERLHELAVPLRETQEKVEHLLNRLKEQK